MSLVHRFAHSCGLALLVLSFASCARAQEEPRAVGVKIGGVDLRLGGTFQPRLSYGFTTGSGEDLQRVGFGVRRARFRATASFGDGFAVHYDVDASGGQFSSVDLYGAYEPTERLRFRAGYMAGAQPRAYIFTSHTRIDAVDRAAIAERWSRGTTGSSGRDFGLDVRYQTKQTTLELFLHNGDDSFDRAQSNFRESVSGLATTRSVDRTGAAVSGYASVEPTAVPGLEIGGFAGYNASRNPNTVPDGFESGRRYVSYSGHVYWGAAPGSQPLRLKADVIGIRYEALEEGGQQIDAQHTLGFAALAAAQVFGYGEAFARFERYHSVLGEGEADDFITGGVSYSLSARRGLPYRQERLTLAYALGLPEDGAPEQHLFVLQLQFVF